MDFAAAGGSESSFATATDGCTKDLKDLVDGLLNVSWEPPQEAR
jgi:hypothetical protein